jgi:hypothetical protein
MEKKDMVLAAARIDKSVWKNFKLKAISEERTISDLLEETIKQAL